MLLVDRIIELEAERIVGIKCVTQNEPFFQGHFPEFPVMPGVLIVEALAQTAGVLVLNQAGGNAHSVAEHVLGMMLVLSKRIVETDRVQG